MLINVNMPLSFFFFLVADCVDRPNVELEIIIEYRV
jgi:hypothetical protein